MSPLNKLYFDFIIFISILANIKSRIGETIFWDITLSEKLIKLGNSGEAFLTIYLNEVPKDIIDFDNTIIIGIDIEKPDPTFRAQVHRYSAKEDEEVYKIDFVSEKIGKNEFIIKLYDYENQREKILTPVEFEIGEKEIIIEEIIPDPSKTNLIELPLEYVGENDTIVFQFSLTDTKGNEIIGNDTFLEKLKVINNGKYSEGAQITLNDDGKIFNVSLPNDYLPLLQEINVEFNGKEDTFNILENNIEVTVVLSPLYLRTIVNCENCENITIDESILIYINLYNYKNISVETNDHSKSFEIVVDGPLEDKKFESKNYSIEKVYVDQNLYKITVQENDSFIHSGIYQIKIYEDSILIKEFEIILEAKIFDLDGFMLDFTDSQFDPKKAYIDTEFGMVLKGSDHHGNIVHLPLENDIELYLENENGTKIEFIKNFDDDKKGNLYINITSETLGYAKLKIYYKEKEILKININEDLPEFFFNFLKCIKSILSQEELDSTVLGKNVSIYLHCLDFNGNKVKRGGEVFTSENYIISEDKYTSFEVRINDLEKGNYSFNFIPYLEGEYHITVYLDNKFFKEIKFDIEKFSCKDDEYLCPNKNLCVTKLKDCIEPPNDCPESTPFYCKVGNEEKCVESQTDCDCPEGYIRCGYMKYCVPETRNDMCANFTWISSGSCKNFKQFKYLGADGICRMSEDLSPTQKACPIGKVLCADLSCRDNYDECAVSDFCEEGQIRCGDQSCVDDYTECPSTISCQNKKYVCSDGSCVDNEIECKALPNCLGDESYRCQDNLCTKDKNSCIKNVACGQKMALCSDLICRVTCNK